MRFQLVDETKKYGARIAEVSDPAEAFAEAADKIFLCKILLHAADLSNPVRPFR